MRFAPGISGELAPSITWENDCRSNELFLVCDSHTVVRIGRYSNVSIVFFPCPMQDD